MKSRLFDEIYPMVGARRVAEVLAALSGMDLRDDATVRRWAMMVRRGEELPDYLRPWIPQMERVLEAELERARGVAR